MAPVGALRRPGAGRQGKALADESPLHQCVFSVRDAGFEILQVAEREELAAAPHAELLDAFDIADLAQVHQMIEDRAQDQRLEPGPDQHVRARLAARLVGLVAAMRDADGVIAIGDHTFVKIGPESQRLVAAGARCGNLDRGEGRVLDRDAAALGRRDQPVFAVAFAAQDGGEQLDQRFPVDGGPAIKPGPIRGDSHVKIATGGQVGELGAGLWVGHDCG